MTPSDEIKQELRKIQEYVRLLQGLLLETGDNVSQVVVQVVNTDLQRLVEKIPDSIPEELYKKHFVTSEDARKEDAVSLGDK